MFHLDCNFNLYYILNIMFYTILLSPYLKSWFNDFRSSVFSASKRDAILYYIIAVIKKSHSIFNSTNVLVLKEIGEACIDFVYFKPFQSYRKLKKNGEQIHISYLHTSGLLFQVTPLNWPGSKCLRSLLVEAGFREIRTRYEIGYWLDVGSKGWHLLLPIYGTLESFSGISKKFVLNCWVRVGGCRMNWRF